jgi:hypothetical protein
MTFPKAMSTLRKFTVEFSRKSKDYQFCHTCISGCVNSNNYLCVGNVGTTPPLPIKFGKNPTATYGSAESLPLKQTRLRLKCKEAWEHFPSSLHEPRLLYRISVSLMSNLTLLEIDTDKLCAQYNMNL